MKKIYVLCFALNLQAPIVSADYTPDPASLFPAAIMEPIIIKNRETLSAIPQWIDDNLYHNSFFWYGLPECVRHLVNKPIGNDITYSDAIVYLATLLKKDIRYLELGTSFGKNFIQVAHAISNSCLVGFDLEIISPVLEGFLVSKQQLDSWKTKEPSLKTDPSSLTAYTQKTNNNTVLYLSGDIYDEKSWERLEGMKFNMLFSDASHYPDAILHEYCMLIKYDLIDPDEFIFIWDDLGGAMTTAFMNIFELLSKKYDLEPTDGFIIPLRGWLGVNEPHHNVGIILHSQK